MANEVFGIRPKINSANGCPMFYELPGYKKMERWKPDEKMTKIIQNLMGMCTDVLMGSGVNAKTFTSNLRLFADSIDEETKNDEEKDSKAS